MPVRVHKVSSHQSRIRFAISVISLIILDETSARPGGPSPQDSGLFSAADQPADCRGCP